MKKRLICFLLMGAVVLCLCSCQNQKKEEIVQVDLLEEIFEQTAQVPQQPAYPLLYRLQQYSRESRNPIFAL